jgi:NADH-quinone oxidoreductase subunit D
LLNVTTQALDVGALTPPLWGFEEREKLMVFYERACGARLHAAYFRPGGVHQDLPHDLVEDIGKWCDPFLQTCDDIEGLLTTTASSSSAMSTSPSSSLTTPGPGAFRA